MSPSKWPDWLELGPDDPIQAGDLWQYKDKTTEPDGIVSALNNGRTIRDLAKESGFKPEDFVLGIYRKGTRVLTGNPHFAKELPLP